MNDKKLDKATEKELKKEEKKKSQLEIDKLKSEIKELEEKLLRNQAELQNFKRRKEDELETIKKYSNEDMVKELLPLIDNFERAIKMDDDNLEDEVSKFLEGFKMIFCSLTGVLNQFNIKEIETKDQYFNPHYHEAIMTDNDIDKPDEIILEVLQKGYMLNDRVIRPTMVKVNINNEENKKEKENDENE